MLNGVNVRVYLDKLPDTKEQCEQFKSFLSALSKSPGFRKNKLKISRENIAEVASHDHDILQCVDIVLGAMQFRLNDKHLEKPKDSHRRAKRTIAKERVYKHINKRIRQIYPHFNIGISTGKQNNIENLWEHPYRHWRFVPAESEVKPGSKRKKARTP